MSLDSKLENKDGDKFIGCLDRVNIRVPEVSETTYRVSNVLTACPKCPDRYRKVTTLIIVSHIHVCRLLSWYGGMCSEVGGTKIKNHFLNQHTFHYILI